MPLFSVLIPSYNRPEVIGKSVESVLSNDFHDFELVISDDKSPRQEDIVRTLQPFLRDSRVHLHLQSSNLGEPGNRDFLFQKASGEWLIALCDDDLLYPNTLSTLTRAIESHPGAGIYAFGYTIIDEFDRVRYSRRAPKPLRVSIHHPRLSRELIVSETFPFWMYHPATFCAKKEVHRKIKSNSNVGIGDDFMFMIDFINLGGIIQIVPAVLMCYRKSASSAPNTQLNLSSGELPQLIARAKIMNQLLLRTDFHPAIADFVKSRECRNRLLYDSVLWSGLKIDDAPEMLELSPEAMAELNLYAKRRPRELYRIWLSLRRVLFFFSIFGLAGLRESANVLLTRLANHKFLDTVKV